MKLNELKPKTRKKPVRRGQGNGTGHGTFSGRGCKGQKARTGKNVRVGFEGGQTPLIQRMPKRRGFTSNKPEVKVISIESLEEHFKAGEIVSVKSLLEKGMIKKVASVKILGDGELTKKLEISAEVKVSKSAKAAIEGAGGKVRELER